MSWLDSSWDIHLDDSDDAKYWRFIGEDWLWYEFSPEEIEWITRMGKRRKAFGDSKTKVNYSHRDGDNLHISGVAGELVVYRLTGQKINQIELGDKDKPDIGRDIEVKTDLSPKVRMQENEKSLMKKLDRRYVLVSTFLYPKYAAIVGWCYGRQFPKQPEQLSWRPDNGIHRLNYNSLYTMDTFAKD